MVEEAIYEHGHYVAMKLYLVMELKKVGARLEDALVQVCDTIAETVDTKGNTFPDEFEVFVVVQSGLKITFFEYHNYQNNLDEEIRNFRGCVSLFPSHKAKISRVSFKRSCLTYHPTWKIFTSSTVDIKIIRIYGKKQRIILLLASFTSYNTNNWYTIFFSIWKRINQDHPGKSLLINIINISLTDKLVDKDPLLSSLV